MDLNTFMFGDGSTTQSNWGNEQKSKQKQWVFEMHSKYNRRATKQWDCVQTILNIRIGMDGGNFRNVWMIQCICRGCVWYYYNMRAKICWFSVVEGGGVVFDVQQIKEEYMEKRDVAQFRRDKKNRFISHL